MQNYNNILKGNDIKKKEAPSSPDSKGILVWFEMIKCIGNGKSWDLIQAEITGNSQQGKQHRWKELLF